MVYTSVAVHMCKRVAIPVQSRGLRVWLQVPGNKYVMAN